MKKKNQKLFARILAIILAVISVLSIALSFAPSNNDVVYNANSPEIITETEGHTGHNHKQETEEHTGHNHEQETEINGKWEEETF